MNTYFFATPQPDVLPVIVPGLPKPVYASPYMAEQLRVLVTGKQPEVAHLLVCRLGGLPYQS